MLGLIRVLLDIFRNARVMQLDALSVLSINSLPSVPADAIHDPSGENLTELQLLRCPRYFLMHSLFFVSHNLREQNSLEG